MNGNLWAFSLFYSFNIFHLHTNIIVFVQPTSFNEKELLASLLRTNFSLKLKQSPVSFRSLISAGVSLLAGTELNFVCGGLLRIGSFICSCNMIPKDSLLAL